MTTALIPTKDYLGEMKRCSKCKRLRDKCKFGRDLKNKDGLNYWCKECRRRWARADHKRKIEAKFRKLNKPFFLYENENMAFRIDPDGNGYRIVIYDKYEHEQIPIPASKMKELRDWLDVKLKEKE